MLRRFHQFLILSLLISTSLFAERTVGLIFNEPDAFQGYTLFAPNSSTTVYLIDNEGYKVHSWVGQYMPGLVVYLLENGHLLKSCAVHNFYFSAGGTGGLIREIDWDGTVIWQYQYSSSTVCQHHDIESLPNGNVLILAWEYKSYANAIGAGRNPSTVQNNKLWMEHVIEIEPTGGDIVWKWHVWDHLIQDYSAAKDNYGVVEDHPELMDLNYVSTMNNTEDWLHANSVDYNPDLDQIMISLRSIGEIWVIDHSTTTAEAAGHTGGNSGMGGDILYRWGNPHTYRAGDESDQYLFNQHDANWIPAGEPGEGNILIFNNGSGRPQGRNTTVVEIVPPVDENNQYTLYGDNYGPEAPIWIYGEEELERFYSPNISGAQRLPNGNTLICDGSHGTFMEVTDENELVWEYINPVTMQGIMTQGDDFFSSPDGSSHNNQVFRAYRYAPDYPGLDEKDLTPKGTIELYPAAVDGNVSLSSEFVLNQNYPNPFNPSTVISFSLPTAGLVSVKIYSLLGELVHTLVRETLSSGDHHYEWDASNLPSGIYIYRLQTETQMITRKMMLLE
ncbi:aryl-sulfate sulfotransferase [candidate division KSB1 bacterium]|nr:aryl-sulfate sulfotransferase [candidate division KSB1 bacterium]